MTPRSYLYVPGDQPAKLARAAERGADALVVDLEDAVAPGAKDAARRHVADWLSSRGDEGSAGDALGPEIWVRVNPSLPDGSPPAADLDVAVHPAVTGIVAAKAESADALARLDDAISAREATVGLGEGAIGVSALVESAAGYLALPALAGSPRVVRLQIGEVDLAASLRMTPGPDAAELLPLRVGLVVASAAAGIGAPVGPVYTALGDLDGLRVTTEALHRLGFAGRSALHPAQVPVINEVFTPTAAELAAATALIERFDAAVAAGDGVITDSGGSMIDEAVVRSARAVLARAEGGTGASAPGRVGDGTVGKRGRGGR